MSPDRWTDRLPESVAERIRIVADRDVPSAGRHILYWMHHGARGHENPALDAALHAAAALARPLLVYQGLGGGHAYDSDRHHTFILEGARDVRVELAARGVTHVLWTGEEPRRPTPLSALADGAALVVTEDFPAPPFPRWTEILAGRTAAPVWAVDTACVVPMRLLDRAFERAFAFRAAIEDHLEERLRRPWIEADVDAPTFDRADLPFPDVDLAGIPIEDIVARCPVDHTVGPVAHSPGGSVAGYERWEAFRDGGLRSYAARRNDAARGGVSRMSPYLHHGHVSPFRLAREAADIGGAGAEKYLDELVVWRELAHNLVFHRHREVESLGVLPRWARETLVAHAADARDVLSSETLARGRTGDRLWDLAQASLVRHGELHNNVRMTWGKAIPGWTADPEMTLATLIELNHRFALDGSDPSSYGGLLWCLGLFDRPFRPEQPILGAVRGRSTRRHANRLDLGRYAARVLPSATVRPLEVAVVGAGLSGLTAAQTLHDHGHRVAVFEKARGPGGRMSTRRDAEWRFDHGASYFTVRDRRFARRVASWRRDGLVAPWSGRIAVVERGSVTAKDGGPERLVAVPGMNAVCEHLAADLPVSYGTRVARIEPSAGRWRLVGEEDADLGSYDAVLVSAPAPQTAALLEPVAPEIARQAAGVDLASCWAAMAVFPRAVDVAFDGAFVRDSALAWVSRNSSKPGRPDPEAWVLHASPEWSREHLERGADEVAARLLDAFREAVGHPIAEPDRLVAHRWRHALPPDPRSESCLFDPALRLGACGDWCGGPRVEGAFLSGAAAAGRILALRPSGGQGVLFG